MTDLEVGISVKASMVKKVDRMKRLFGFNQEF
jgi:hypothetical protein